MKHKLVVLSDTHGFHDHVRVPLGDILIHCGDCTNDLGQASLRNFLIWFDRQPHKLKLFIAGNHDGAFENWPQQAREMVKDVADSCVYLEDSGYEYEGIKFWGSPVTPSFCNWFFNRDRGQKIKCHWDKIPQGTDVLITHGPPNGILDKSGFDNENAGCEDLLDAVQRIKPQIHCFGHIHHSYGAKQVDGTVFVNASICDEGYKPTRQPWVL